MPQANGLPAWALNLRGEGSDSLDLDIYDEIGTGGFFSTGISSKDIRERLNAAKNAKTINVTINSVGGVVTEGLGIYADLASHKARVDVRVVGCAASISSVIAMAGDTVTMDAGSFLMIHSPWGIAKGSEEQFRSYADQLAKNKAEIVSIYAAKTGQSATQIRDWMAHETWFNGDEAKQYGFATAVVRPKRSDPSVTHSFASLVAFASLEPGRFTNLPEPIRNAIELGKAAPALTGTETLEPQAPVAALTQLSPPDGRSETPIEGTGANTMALTILAAAIGLAATATDEAVQARVTELVKLEASTGKSGPAAQGVVAAWKDSHDALPAVVTERDTLKTQCEEFAAKDTAREIDSLITKAKAENKLWPAQEKTLRDNVASGVFNMATVKAFIDTCQPHAERQVVVPPKAALSVSDFSVPNPAAAGAPALNATDVYENFTPDELARLRGTDEGAEQYATMRASWEERGKPKRRVLRSA